jgi:hypothetical protein
MSPYETCMSGDSEKDLNTRVHAGYILIKEKVTDE